MNNWIILFIVSLCSLSFALPIQDRKIDPNALAELALGLNISKNANIIEETQRRWLRASGQERWEMAELSSYQKSFVLNWATEQGIFAPWKPFYKTYDKALILGAATSQMQMRLDYLKQLWEDGVRFDEVVWLTGDRPLDIRVDGLTDRCSNESEAARVLWEETDLPEEMRALSVVFVAVPMKRDGACLKRPNTKDTIVAWLNTAPQACSALFISNQPFCRYQFAVIKASLPSMFSFDVVGQGADPTSRPAAAAITLDSVARWIYQESLCQNNLENHQ
jgi:hypothetical protein